MLVLLLKAKKTFNIHQIITSVNEYTKNRLNYLFEEIDEFKNVNNYAKIDLSDLELSDDVTPKFTLGPLVEQSTEQSISIDIVGGILCAQRLRRLQTD